MSWVRDKCGYTVPIVRQFQNKNTSSFFFCPPCFLIANYVKELRKETK